MFKRSTYTVQSKISRLLVLKIANKFQSDLAHGLIRFTFFSTTLYTHEAQHFGKTASYLSFSHIQQLSRVCMYISIYVCMYVCI